MNAIIRKLPLLAALLLIPALVRAQTSPDLNYANPKEYEIAEITVSGSKFLDNNALVSITGLKVGDKIRIPGDDISGAIRKLWDQGILGDVQIYASKIEGEKVFLNIYLKERARLSRFVFKGIKKGEIDALTDKIKLIRGKVVDDALIKNTQLTVKKHFVEKGFLNTTVNMVQAEDDSSRGNTVTLRINVNKKKKVKINQIAINGNEVFEDKKLRKKMKKTKQRSPFRIFTPSKFIATEYEEDKKKLIAFYNSEGYRDALILSDSIYPHDENSINIKLDIEEGRKYYYRNITWAGNYIYTDQQLAYVLGIKKGDVYNVEELEKRLNFNPSGADITSQYMDNGYLFFRITPTEIAVEGDSIDVEMQIYEGAQATINEVRIIGNTRTSDHVILREIRTLPGQKFSRAQLIRTQQEISALGYFNPETVNPVPIPNQADGTVDIEWQLEERPSDQIELSGGWGGGGRNGVGVGFVGTLGVVFNNFSMRKLFKWGEWGGVLPSGDGQRLSIRFQASGSQYQTYSMSFTEPWLFGRRPQSFSVNLTHSVQRPGSYFGSNFSANSLFQISGVTLSLGRRLKKPDDYFSLSNSISYLVYNLKEYPAFVDPATGEPVNNGIFNNLTFNTTLSRNSIDNPTFPRRGSSMSLSVTATPPYSTWRGNDTEAGEGVSSLKYVEYHKWMFDSNWFLTLAGKLVLSTRAHLGFIGRYSSDSQFTPFERFVLGGSGLAGQNFLLAREIVGLRGYPDQRVGPGTNGGVVYDKFVMELRYPISLNPSATIFVLGFLEGGNNWDNYSEYNPFNLKRSAGVGARIFMPAFGLIGIDYGYGFDEIPGVQEAGKGQFHFTIGQQIR